LILTILSALQKQKGRIAIGIILFALVGVYGSVSYSRAGIFKSDAIAFADVLEKYPDSVVALLTMGDHRYQQNKFDAASAYYIKALHLTDGKNELAWNNLGDIYFRRKVWDKAETCFRNSGKKGERNLAILLFVQKRSDEVLPLLEKLKIRFPNDDLLDQMIEATKKLIAGS
jgi:tetratricopeptide (TPR) repeat protein